MYLDSILKSRNNKFEIVQRLYLGYFKKLSRIHRLGDDFSGRT